MNPGSTNVGSTIVKNDIGLPVLQLATDEVSTLRSSDIGSKCDNTRYRLNWDQVNTCKRAVRADRITRLVIKAHRL